MKSLSLKDKQLKKRWYIIDASGKILGRLASKIACILRGKANPTYTPNINTGDYIIVINAKHIKITGNKYNNKLYYHHTGFVGGIKCISFKDLSNKNPRKLIEKAVKGMLPKGPLSSVIHANLKVYEDESHFHQAQDPKLLLV
ncbi:50S ribosomal protein L13 [Candidatus Tremblaya phenacola]|nr:50S ribosomal protein L13 [Candidatus Tremblaya phenacola]